MAKDEDGQLIDPFGGEKDLREGVLRHVSEAFAEDPVRILRVARFAARFGFRIAHGNHGADARMVDFGEADALVAERVWQEFARGLMETHPALHVRGAASAAGSARHAAGAQDDRAALERFSGSPRPVRFAVLTWALEETAVARAVRAAARAERSARARGDRLPRKAAARGARAREPARAC